MLRVWESNESDPALVEALTQSLGVHPLIASILVHRNIKGIEEARRFLSPSLGDLHDPRQMKDMDLAVGRILQAVRNKQSICIYGDYDVDGVTSVAVLSGFLNSIGVSPAFYIPSRLDEGYGLNLQSVAEIAGRGTQLLITVDCGITDLAQVAQARKLGMDVIVIDHHQVPEQMPDATAILNPFRSDCTFPYKHLAAVGVVFNLVMALRATIRENGGFDNSEEPNLREFLDLVALGTVADIVPLLDVNRVITRFGLAELTAARRPGIAALKEVSGILSDQIEVGQVAFRLAPRINAVGRLGHAALAVELLTTRSYSRALILARELDRTNIARQGIEHEIFEQALKMAKKLKEDGDPPALVLAADGWHVGVVGIVASKLVERFACPVILIAWNGEIGRGSARGTDQVHLYQALCDCAGMLDEFGGHRAAAGLTLQRARLADFRKGFLSAIQGQLGESAPTKRFFTDGLVSPWEWSIPLVESLRTLAPFGLGNPEPIFMARRLRVKSTRLVGRDPPYHLKLSFIDEQRGVIEAIGFGMGDRVNEVVERVDLLYSPDLNSWAGNVSLQLKIKDLRPCYD